MKLTFVLPKGKHGFWDVRTFKMPPLGLLTLASTTPEEWEVEIIDENIEKIKYEDTDLVAISVTTATANRAYRIGDTYRSMGTKVIMGGIHPSVMPDEAIQYADSVVIGEADLIWRQILDDFKNQRLKKIYKVENKPDLSKIPPLKRNLIKKKYYLSNIVHTSRGCPSGCDFCSTSSFNGREFRHSPIQYVLSELCNLNNGFKRFFSFTDDNIVADPVYSKALFKAIKPLNLKWGSPTSINIAKDQKLLRLAAESGCKSLLIGFESLNQDSLNEVHKAYNVQEYKEMIKRIHDYGIALVGAFVFGFDSDKKDVFKKTIDFCNNVNLDIAQFTVLTPFPGTKLFERLNKSNRIITYNWDYYDAFHTVFKPKKMSVKELQNGVKWCYDNFYSGKSIMKRVLSLMPKIGLRSSLSILATNYYFRKLTIW